MTSIPAPAGGVAGDAAGDAPGGAAGGEVGGFDDAEAGASVTALLAAVDGLVAVESWRCSQADLARLVQVTEVAARRLGMVQAAAAVDAHGRGVPQAGAGCHHRRCRPGRHGTLDRRLAAFPGEHQPDPGQGAGQGRGRPARRPGPLAELAETSGGRAGWADQHRARAGDRRHGHPAVPAAGPGRRGGRADTRAPTPNGSSPNTPLVLDPVQTRVLAARTIAVLDPDAGDRLAKDEDARDGLRGLTLARQASGLVHLTGVLTPECAGVLTTAIDAAAAPRPAADASPDTRTPAMRRHDGLQHVLEQVVAADGLSRPPTAPPTGWWSPSRTPP